MIGNGISRAIFGGPTINSEVTPRIYSNNSEPAAGIGQNTNEFGQQEHCLALFSDLQQCMSVENSNSSCMNILSLYKNRCIASNEMTSMNGSFPE